MPTIEIPSFEFSGIYYHEILQDLIVWKRVHLPEFSDEDPTEPLIQLLRAFALSAHLNNVLLDAVARERFLPTARTRRAVAAHLALIGVQLRQAAPATADLLFSLAREFTTTATVIPIQSKFATEGQGGVDGVVFEVLTALTTARTDQLGWIRSYDASADAWTEHTVGASFTPGWGAQPAAGDILYFGHTDAMWDKIRLNLSTPGSGIAAGVWEYYDDELDDAAPDSVTNNSTYLTLELNDWLGEADRSGTLVRVKSNVTGAFEDDLVVEYAGGVNHVHTTTLLGQTTVSTDPDDYSVGSHWQQLPGISDGSVRLTTAGSSDVDYDLPQDATQNWSKVSVGAAGYQDEGYWIRFRVVACDPAPTNPVVASCSITEGKRYLLGTAAQGESRDDNPLGSSSGLASQAFTLASYPVIDDATLRVFVLDEEIGWAEWTRVTDFVSSIASDPHFRVTFDDDGRATIQFGDGTNGMVPPAGSDNLRATYRVLVEGQNGNAGPNAITVNRAGNAYIDSVTNPRTASGYAPADGSTDASLEQVKISGPATLRSQSKGVSAADIEALVALFQAADGSRPFGRALVVEEALGPKTVQAVVVGSNGGAVLASYLEELEEYFNGSDTTHGVLLLNHELSAVNFAPCSIAVTATIYGGSADAVENALGSLLTPLARKNDGVTWEWDFGGEVPTSRIIAAIMNTSPQPRRVDLSVPATNIDLADRELPVLGAVSITVVP